jgi:hypothetical protein
MTQLKKLEQLLTELGIPFEKRESQHQAYASEEGMVDASAWEDSIDITEGMGLPGFVASFYFDGDETFLAHRIWKRG